MIACCYLLHPSASHAASHAGGPISAAILQGWVTAISTAVLAIFAIVTAIFAIRAFRKQSQEVRDQASMLEVQSEQLAEQRKVNEKQIEVLGLQGNELRKAAADRLRAAEELKHAQASRVYIETEIGPDPRISQAQRAAGAAAPETVTAHVKNDSDQPIYYAELIWDDDSLGYNEMLVWPGAERLAKVIPAGGEASRTKDPIDTPDARDAVLLFRDAVGVSWLRAPDGDLMDTNRRAPNEEAWARSFRKIIEPHAPDGAAPPDGADPPEPAHTGRTVARKANSRNDASER